MDEINNIKGKLPIILVVQDANEDNIQQANKTIKNFYDALESIEDDADIVVNTLVCSDKYYWLQKDFQQINAATRYSFKIGHNNVDIKKAVDCLTSQKITLDNCFMPIIFFFLTSDFTDGSFAYIKELDNFLYERIIVKLSKSNENALFIKKLELCKRRTKILGGGARTISREVFVSSLTLHLIAEKRTMMFREMERRTRYSKVSRHALDSSQLNKKQKTSTKVRENSRHRFCCRRLSKRASRRTTYKKDSLINYSLISEKEIKRNGNFVIDFVMYVDEYKDKLKEVIKEYNNPSTKSGALIAETESEITLILHSPNVQSIYDEESFIWNGKFSCISLGGRLDDYKGNNILLIVDILINGIKVTAVKTTIDFLKPLIGSVPFIREDAKNIFFSYSNKDRKTVLNIVNKTKGIVDNSVTFFLDVLTLRAGEIWRNRIYEEIDKCDTFCLIWSYSAYHSKWVKKEWEYALDNKGISVFNPININDEKKHHVPIPRRLSSIHFANYGVLNKNNK